jgi:outer membrane protein OmpA-like peptidoglycan-associated protein
MKKYRFTGLACLIILFLIITPLLAGEQTNLTSSARGAKIVSFSSNYGGMWDVNSLIDPAENPEEALPTWCTEAEAPFPHWVVIELPKQEWLTTLIFNNFIPDEEGWPGISAKDVRVETSTSSSSSGFKTVASFQLERNKNDQLVRLEPLEARWIKIVITSNYGNPEYTELGKLGVFDDGSRGKNLAAELKDKGYIDIYGIYFDFASARLRPESDPVLKQIAVFSAENPSVKLIIEGHTDNVGGDKSNQLLSENRAKSVVTALTKLGVNSNLLSASGLGSSNPVADNSTITGRAKNRRVTIRVIN